MVLNSPIIKTTNSESETLDFGKEIAKLLEPGDILCLFGEMGAGKTHFVKGIASGLDIDPNIVHSPTFTLIHEYKGTLPVYHFDAYRIESVREAMEIGTEEYLYSNGVSLIEWPEKIAELIPKEAIRVKIDKTDIQKRTFHITKT